MEINDKSPLLGGLSPRQFMRRHWQKKPLLVRAAVPRAGDLLAPAELFTLAGRDEVQSRLIQQQGGQWRVRHGPFTRRQLPARTRPGWTLLVQGVDLHQDALHALLGRFRFVPDARLDDAMVSHASDGGGVGPHFDSYDVFLLQLHGRRRWRIGRQRDLTLVEGAPLKILSRFEPEQEFVLDAGDMLYLPPRWAHEGVALGACTTCSIGFRAPERSELACELLGRIADMPEPGRDAVLRYSDPGQPASARPARVPAALRHFARDAVRAALRQPDLLAQALGEWLTEPKPEVWFDPAGDGPAARGLRLDRRSRMLYDARHVFINGESLRTDGPDARLLRRLADRRTLSPRDTDAASPALRAQLSEWLALGWLVAD